VRYVRKQRRHPVGGAAIVSVNGEAMKATVLDLSTGGAGLRVDSRLAPGTRVSLHLDSFPHAGLGATVQSIAKGGADGFRLGLAFSSVPAQVQRRLCALADAPAPAEPELAMTAAGRERLYQAALALVADDRFADARQTAMHALRGDPRNVTYRALISRTHALDALAAGQLEAAERECRRALVLSPNDADLKILAAKIAEQQKQAQSKKGFLARLWS
jgi:hypothetical protein